jgi:hypothetical protein
MIAVKCTCIKVHVVLDISGVKVNETIEGCCADDVISKAKKLTAKKAGFLAGMVIRKMSNIKFAAKAVSLYDKKFGTSSPEPKTPEEFISWAVSQNLATILEP